MGDKMDILFDLYGTLIDIYTEESNITFWKKFARRTIKYKRYDADSLKNKYLLFCDKYQKEKEEIDILDIFKEIFDVDLLTSYKIANIFRRLSRMYVKLYPGVKNLLLELKKIGIRIYVLSNAQTAFTIPELKRLGIFHLFNGIAISSEFGLKNPNTLFYQKEINGFGLDYQNLIIIGNDYECDIIPALKLGLKTIFIKSNLTFSHFDKEGVNGFNKKIVLKKIKFLI